MILWWQSLNGWERDMVSREQGLERESHIIVYVEGENRRKNIPEARFERFRGDCSRRLIRRTLEDTNRCELCHRQKDGHAGLGEKCFFIGSHGDSGQLGLGLLHFILHNNIFWKIIL